jgi:hypothetical protein
VMKAPIFKSALYSDFYVVHVLGRSLLYIHMCECVCMRYRLGTERGGVHVHSQDYGANNTT